MYNFCVGRQHGPFYRCSIVKSTSCELPRTCRDQVLTIVGLFLTKCYIFAKYLTLGFICQSFSLRIIVEYRNVIYFKQFQLTVTIRCDFVTNRYMRKSGISFIVLFGCTKPKIELTDKNPSKWNFNFIDLLRYMLSILQWCNNLVANTKMYI